VTLAQHDDHFLLSFRKDVSFLGKVQVKHHLRHIPDRAAVIIDATRADYIDHDVLELLDAFIADAPQRSISVEFRRGLSHRQDGMGKGTGKDTRSLTRATNLSGT
jgi:MFS superfamily sulfate permease-like transporter